MIEWSPVHDKASSPEVAAWIFRHHKTCTRFAQDSSPEFSRFRWVSVGQGGGRFELTAFQFYPTFDPLEQRKFRAIRFFFLAGESNHFFFRYKFARPSTLSSQFPSEQLHPEHSSFLFKTSIPNKKNIKSIMGKSKELKAAKPKAAEVKAVAAPSKKAVKVVSKKSKKEESSSEEEDSDDGSDSAESDDSDDSSDEDVKKAAANGVNGKSKAKDAESSDSDSSDDEEEKPKATEAKADKDVSNTRSLCTSTTSLLLTNHTPVRR